MKNRLCLVLILLMGFNTLTYSQQVEKGFELLQLLKIAETYQNLPNLSFNMTYTYADSTTPSTLLETIIGSAKVRNGKYWTMLDSVEFVQGQQYDIAVYYNDSSIIVNDQSDYGNILKIPALDSVFQNANVDSMRIVEYNDTTRLLTIFFNQKTLYSLYKVQYDKTKFLIRKIEYYTKSMPDISGNTSGITGLITLVLSGYSENPVDPTFFDEDRYIYKSNGELLPKPTYQRFKIYNNTITKQFTLNENNN